MQTHLLSKNVASLEIGYLVKKEFWRQGYGSAICDYLLKIADNHFPASPIVGLIDPENESSKKLLLKLGFESKFIGTQNRIPTEILERKI